MWHGWHGWHGWHCGENPKPAVVSIAHGTATARAGCRRQRAVCAALALTLASVGVSLAVPPGWEAKVTKDGRTYYVDHNTKKTSWKQPVMGTPTS